MIQYFYTSMVILLVNYLLLVGSMVYLVMPSVGIFWCIIGALRNFATPSPTIHYTLPRFIFKDPDCSHWEPPETRGHPGCNDKSKDHPRAHKRRIKPLQDLSFRNPWDSVSRRSKTSKFCMLHTRPSGTPYTHKHQLSILISTKKKPSRHYP